MDSVRHDLTSVGRFPPEYALGYIRVFVHAGAHEYVVSHSALYKKLRKHAVMTERVDIVAGMTYPSEFIIVIKLAVKSLSCKTLRRGDVAVGLNVPAVYDDPSALLNAFAYLSEHLGVGIFNPLVIRSGRAVEYCVVVLRKPVKRGAERLHNLVISVEPSPQPYGVKVRVAYYIN